MASAMLPMAVCTLTRTSSGAERCSTLCCAFCVHFHISALLPLLAIGARVVRCLFLSVVPCLWCKRCASGTEALSLGCIPPKPSPLSHPATHSMQGAGPHVRQAQPLGRGLGSTGRRGRRRRRRREAPPLRLCAVEGAEAGRACLGLALGPRAARCASLASSARVCSLFYDGGRQGTGLLYSVCCIQCVKGGEAGGPPQQGPGRPGARRAL